MQEIIQMCNFEGTKSTKGASKLRRDLINSEISQLRDLLPLPPSTRQRLSQLQLMALVCVYVRKSNYFQQVLKHQEHPLHHGITPNIGFSKALNGFIMMMTQGGKLLFISDNAAEHLGHSMEDLLIHGDSVFDIIDKQDHAGVQAELVRASQTPSDEDRLFLCRMNVSRNARRQMRFGDQKVILVQGHYLSYIPLCSRNEPVFLAHCTPVAMPETRDCVAQGATNIFSSVHTLDMKFINIDSIGEYYLGYSQSSLAGVSWYHLVHPDSLREVQTKHRLITSSEQDRSCILLLRLQSATGEWRWIHCVLQVKDSGDVTTIPNQGSGQTTQQPVIIATNQVLGEKEASVLRANSWLYHYYAMQSKLQYGIAYDTQRVHPYYPQVMPYQADATSHYMNSSLNSSAVHQHSISHGAASAYSLAAGANYLQHYHHPYSVRLHHGLDYTTAAAAATRDSSWNYYNTTTEQSPPTQTHSYNQASPQQTSPTSNNYAKIPRKSTPTKSPRRSPHTPPTPLGSESSGGVSVIAPVAIRPSPNTSLKGVTSGMEDLETSSWKSSPSQEVPDCYDYPFITPPYTATPSKALSFSFEPCDPKETIIKDHRVPSLEASENLRWSNELPSTRSPWLPPDEITGPLRVLSNL